MAPTVGSPLSEEHRRANEAMTRYADGDATAFPSIYDAVAPRIEAFVRRRIRDPSRVDDIVQQTFERLHRARATFIPGADVVSWSLTIARNLCIDLGAKGWREQITGSDVANDPVANAVAEIADAERLTVARETLDRVVSAFQRLPMKQQLALELVRVEGFPLVAAAQNLGMSLPTLKNSVFRGAVALRQALAEDAAPRARSRNPFARLRKVQSHGVT